MTLLRMILRAVKESSRRATRNKESIRRSQIQCESLEERLAFSTVTMTANEQLLVELINRARANPLAEVTRVGGISDLNENLSPGTITSTAKQPLAPHQALIQAAGAHSQDMLDRDYFSHFTPENLSPSDRALAAGYPVGVGENIAWGGTTGTINQIEEVYARHISLFRSAGHRSNMLTDSYRELGTGIRYGQFLSGGTNWNASMVSESFGNRGGNVFITGVAYTDEVTNDDFYTIGEGVTGVTVTAKNMATGATFSVVTGISGGYYLQVPNGTYTIEATGGSISGQILQTGIAVNGSNVKADIITTMGTPVDPVPSLPSNGMGIVGRSGGAWWQAESTGSNLNINNWGLWSALVTWDDVQTADVDGDGHDDVIGRTNGQWWVARSTGSAFVNELWTTWSTRVQWRDVQVGDFNNDGRDDIIGRASNGGWWVARSNGTGFVNEYWGSWSTAVNWTDVKVGDYDGDGRDDIVGRGGPAGWWVGRSQGNGFVNERWGVWSAAVTWSHVRIGDFNGDGRDDIIGRTSKSWWIAESTGSGFNNKLWVMWSDAVTWSDVMVGDLDGDGRDDLIGRTGSQWWATRTSNSQAVTELWSTWNPLVSWNDARLIDVNRDGRQDLVGRTASDWWVGVSDGTQAVSSFWGRWPAGTDWTDVLVGDFG